MDALGSAATIVQLVSFTGEVLARGYGYLAKVKNAPLELKSLLQETVAIDALLEQLEVLVLDKKSDSGEIALGKLEQLGILTDCNVLVKVVEGSLKACQQISGQRIRNVGKRMTWPFKAKETKDTMDQLRKMREALSAAIVVDSAFKLRGLEILAKEIDRNVISALENLFSANKGLEEIKYSVCAIANDVSAVRRTIELKLRDEEIIAIKRWLYPDNISTQTYFETALKMKEPRTGNWILNSKDFKSWQDSNQACLWIYGFAGCGKTVISASIIDHLAKSSHSGEFAVIFFFCDRRDSSQQTFSNLLSSICKQLIESSSKSLLCLEEAKNFHDSNLEENRNGPTLAKPLTQLEYVDFVRKLCSNWKRVDLVIDALDECSEITEFSSGLNRLQHESNVKLILTSRDEHHIKQAIYPLTSQTISLQNGMDEDIHTFLSQETRRRIENGSLKLRDKGLETQIVSNLKKKADGIILIAKLQLRYICELRSDRSIREALESLPSEIHSIYDNMLEQICSKYPRDTDDLKQILLWLAYSKAPLTVEQLAEVLSIRPGDESLDKSGIANDPNALLECCGAFVIIRTDTADSGEYEDLRGQVLSIVTLSHASVEEYIKSPKPLPILARLLDILPKAAELTLAKKCLQYIGFKDFKDPLLRDKNSHVEGETLDLRRDRSYLKARISEYPFYDYACQYWPKHLRKVAAESPLDEETHRLLKWFVKCNIFSGNFVSWQQIYHHDIEYCCPGRPALYYAIEFQIKDLASSLFPPDEKLNELNADVAPIHVAARCGATIIMKELIERGASITLNSSGKLKSMSPLHFAAEGGHVGAIELLLSHGAPIEARSKSHSTPFFRAARSGHLRALQLLKERGSDINATTWDGWTPLFNAVAHGRREIAVQLLDLGADPTIRTNHGESVLSLLNWAQMGFYAEDDQDSVKFNSKHSASTRLVNGCLKVTKDISSALEEYSSTEATTLACIQEIRQQEPGLKKWYSLLKYMKTHYYSMDRMEKDTRSAQEREKDQRWVIDPRYIIKLSGFENSYDSS